MVAIPGIHLTRIGKGNFLLEPLRSMDIADQGRLMQEIVVQVRQGQGVRLYYDLNGLPVIDPVYYGWLSNLARTCRIVNIEMICINMEPTAAFTLSSFVSGKPEFATALAVPD
jgi:rsbT antagonist protein RsbS